MVVTKITLILKKLDRVMRNEAFICEYPHAYAIFLPSLISDHCPVVLVMLNTIQGRKKSFRFSNFVAEKVEFPEIVKENGDLFENVKDLRDKLKEIQHQIDIDPQNKMLREDESTILREYEESMKEEDKLLFQKSKIKWLIHDEGGARYEGDQVADQFVKHFQKFLGESIPVHKMHGILSEINSTIIALVPKIQTPAKLSDYRPIACCNVINKCISKFITERIKKFLGKLVSQNQSAFINRQIHDNILISQELLKGYGRKSGPKIVALKIDLQKAYDTVNWSFMEDILKGFGFPESMVNWIMVCVTSTSFSIAVNGKSCGFFRGGRGLRQGDPMSPYLFTLVMEILNLLMIRKIESNGLFQYHFGCKQLKITHVCFADDLLMFCHGDPDSVRTIKEVIEEFGSVSRLLPNYNKSTIIFGSMNADDRQILSYAGRLQLVASIFESIQVYWATVFLLPQSVIEDINRLLKGFLWNQSDKSNGKAKVAWKNL
ncbi:RNA-directed DNA polymerase, eukaryota, reverse transcriptase zinc-binding domain protein, partial [Tanacetum coccineum]